MQKLSTQPYKGARDFYPEEMRVRNFIFDTWRKVCRLHGFEEYDFPILEPLEIFAAKTGEEIVNDQLFSFEDKAGRKLAMRPEITPGTVRLIAQKYKELQQPIKWFMIGNNWRYEKPQTGRGREFYQLEVNVFGEPSCNADFEIFLIIIDIMKAFCADRSQYELRFSDRRIINLLLAETLKLDEETQVKVRRMMDKRPKITKEVFFEELTNFGLDQSHCEKVEQFMKSDFPSLDKVIPEALLKENFGYQSVQKLVGLLNQNNLLEFTKFDPSIIRGFDYSDGLVYEVFDKNPENSRSMFGGERFDKLINIFNDAALPATGFAMGDHTLLEFLTNWKLLPELLTDIEYFVTVWPSDDTKFFSAAVKTAEKLRAAGKNAFLWLDQTAKLDKQLKYADKRHTRYAIICGEEELSKGNITVKDLQKNTQETKELDSFFAGL